MLNKVVCVPRYGSVQSWVESKQAATVWQGGVLSKQGISVVCSKGKTQARLW
jgi:hypothetical protein